MRCARVQERLLLYLAGELSAQESARITMHIERCEICSAAADSLQETHDRTAAVLQSDVDPPTTLDDRVLKAIRSLPPPSRRRFSWAVFRRTGPALAAVGASIALIVFVSLLFSARSIELVSLGKAHGPGATAASPLEMERMDPQRLGQELTVRMRFPVKVVDLSSEGAGLIGGTHTTIDRVGVAALRYRWQGKMISLFEMDGAKATPTALRQIGREPDSYYVHKSGELTYVAWHSGGTDCVMVARAVPMHQLFHLACRACERQERL